MSATSAAGTDDPDEPDRPEDDADDSRACSAEFASTPASITIGGAASITVEDLAERRGGGGGACVSGSLVCVVCVGGL